MIEANTIQRQYIELFKEQISLAYKATELEESKTKQEQLYKKNLVKPCFVKIKHIILNGVELELKNTGERAIIKECCALAENTLTDLMRPNQNDEIEKDGTISLKFINTNQGNTKSGVIHYKITFSDLYGTQYSQTINGSERGGVRISQPLEIV